MFGFQIRSAFKKLFQIPFVWKPVQEYYLTLSKLFTLLFLKYFLLWLQKGPYILWRKQKTPTTPITQKQTTATNHGVFVATIVKIYPVKNQQSKSRRAKSWRGTEYLHNLKISHKLLSNDKMRNSNYTIEKLLDTLTKQSN